MLTTLEERVLLLDDSDSDLSFGTLFLLRRRHVWTRKKVNDTIKNLAKKGNLWYFKRTRGKLIWI